MPKKTQKVYKSNNQQPPIYKKFHLNQNIGKMTRKLNSSLNAKWEGFNEIEYIFNQYFKKKYKACIYQVNIDFTKQTNTSITESLNDMAKNIQKCLRSTKIMRKDTIIITFGFYFYTNVTISGHQNFLAFRPTGINKDNSQPILEWFEPHGKCFILDPTNQVTIKIQETVELFNQILERTFKKTVKLVYPHLICPDKGVQSIEAPCNTLPKNADGYCMLWSYLFIEFILEHQGISTQEINESFLKKYNEPEKLRAIMLTYSKVLSSKLEKYKTTSLNEIIDEILLKTGSNANAVDLITKVRNKMLTKKQKMLMKKNKMLTKKQKSMKKDDNSKKSIINKIIGYVFNQKSPVSESEAISEESEESEGSLFSTVSKPNLYNLKDKSVSSTHLKGPALAVKNDWDAEL